MEDGKRAGVHKGLTPGAELSGPAARNTRAGAKAQLIRSCLQGRDPTTLQNTLMRMPDKVCAVGLAEITPEEREPFYALLAPRKVKRVIDEIRYVALRRTTPLMHARIIREFLAHFGQGRSSGGRIWIRPRKP